MLTHETNDEALDAIASKYGVVYLEAEEILIPENNSRIAEELVSMMRDYMEDIEIDYLFDHIPAPCYMIEDLETVTTLWHHSINRYKNAAINSLQFRETS